ncbi:MAG: sulfatase [Planctomycetota bacterium]|jgi:iduronate 2-sulfatase
MLFKRSDKNCHAKSLPLQLRHQETNSNETKTFRTRRDFLKSVMAGSVACLVPSAGFAKSVVNRKRRLNVVLIVCDDLNDYVSGMAGHPQASTPHIARLAESGVAFKRAYSNNPICAPSRSSFLTGIYPHTSKNLFWDKWHNNPVLKNSKTIMEHFGANGYHVVGSGKLMHHHLASVWGEFKYKADYGPFVYDGKDRVAHPSVPAPYSSIGPVDGSYAPLSDVPYGTDRKDKKGWIYGTWGKVKKFNYVDEENRDPTPDERNAAWAESKIKEFAKEGNSKPFVLGVGFIRPHTPLHVPKRFFDMFPIESVKVPVIKSNDAEDCHYTDVFDSDKKGLKYFRLLKESYPDLESALKAFTQAYLASVAAVDECIGRVVEAVDNSSFKDNTIIVVTSDHGWNMGEKDYLFKNSLWEESTRVPLVIRAPGVAEPGGIAEHPVSLIDIYPTLVDLCGLRGDTRKNSKGAKLDGYSVVPFLKDPKFGRWDGPDAALTMVYAGGYTGNDPSRQHWSVRTKKWRYILYNNGSEELYDHETDPYEWTNLCGEARYRKVKAQLRSRIFQMTGLQDK